MIVALLIIIVCVLLFGKEKVMGCFGVLLLLAIAGFLIIAASQGIAYVG